VRQGKRFELEVDGEVTDDVLARINDLAGTLLSNPVIEDYAVHVEGRRPEPVEGNGA
jgi:phosphoribosylformylglycinamidine synthase subunit PurS